MDFSTITSFIKLPKKVIFLITIITTILLFSPQSFMEKISLFKFKEEYTMWIGIVFIFTLGLTIINLIEFFIEKLNIRKLAKLELELLNVNKKEYQKILESLDEDELVNIREFYLQEKNTIEMIYDYPAVAGLVKKGIINFVSKKGWSNTYTQGTVFLFEISYDAKIYFNTFDFTKLNDIPRPKWLDGIENSKKMNQQLQNLQNNIFS